MKLIFEGPDFAGKSTIAKLVAERLGWTYRDKIVRCKPTETMWINYLDLHKDGDLVLDRCYWLSDTIYEPWATGNASVYLPFLDDMQKLMNDEDAYIIYITCDKESREARGARGDELWTVEQVHGIAEAYDKFMKEHPKVPAMKISNNNGTELEPIVQDIVTAVQQLIDFMK